MFTGIVQAKARIHNITSQPGGLRLIIDRSRWQPTDACEPLPGHSICINGVCLTVVENTDNLLHFDVIRETLDKSTLGSLSVGDEVNIEPAVTASQPLGGHFMQGHVDGVGKVTNVIRQPEETRITIHPPQELADYFVSKGSVAVDGVSLTIAEVHREQGQLQFTVALIPTTLQITTLGQTEVGDRTNLEADIISKTVVHHLQARAEMAADGKISTEMLHDAGFIHE